MVTHESVLQRLDNIERMLIEQSLATKEILSLTEAAVFLNISHSYLYKLTAGKKIAHFCPQGKKLYFKREDLTNWLLRNKQDEEVTPLQKLNNLTIGTKRRN